MSDAEDSVRRRLARNLNELLQELRVAQAGVRILFRYGRRERIISVANKFALAGVVCLAAAVTGTVLLISEVILGGWAR